MKKLTTVLIAGLLLVGSLPVQAGSREDYRDRHFQPDRHSRHFDQRPRHNHHGRHAPAWGVLGAGLALGAIALTIEAPRPPVVVRPGVRPPGQMWYFCESAGAYYPYVNYCAEGWRTVPATPY